MLEVARARIAELEEKVGQLETALRSRIVIEQAKGILGERLSVDVNEAFDILRYAARSHRENIHVVAGRVVNERATPAPVIVAVARSQRARAAWMREIAEAHQARMTELHAAMADHVARLQQLRDRRTS
jgi:cell division septum initiation protein DivIVA